MLEQLRSLFFEYSNGIILIPLLIIIINYRHLPIVKMPLLCYLILATITQAISFILWKRSINNYPVLHLYTLLEYLVLLWFFAVILKGFLNKKFLIALAVIFPVLLIIDSAFIESVFTFNTYGRTLEALILIFFCTCWWIKIAGEENTEAWQYQPINFIVTGLLVYFAGSISLFSYSNFVENMTPTLRLSIWTMHTVLAVLLYILISIGLWKMKPK